MNSLHIILIFIISFVQESSLIALRIKLNLNTEMKDISNVNQCERNPSYDNKKQHAPSVSRLIDHPVLGASAETVPATKVVHRRRLRWCQKCTSDIHDDRDLQLRKYHMECFDETKVDPDLVLSLKCGNWDLTNESLKKWTLCVLNKYDLMSPQGVFRLDTALAKVPKQEHYLMEDFIDECLPTSARAPHEIAWFYTKCYHTKAKDPKHKEKKLDYLNLFY